MPGYGDRSYEEKYPKATGGGKNEWLKLDKPEKVGDTAATPIRIVSSFEDFGKHQRGGSSPVVCFGRDEGCPDCLQAYEFEANREKGSVDKKEPNPYRVNPRFLAWAKDLRDNQIKLFEYGWSIQSLLEGYADDPDWSFTDGVPDFNIKIICERTGTQKQNVEYSITPSPKMTPLSDEEKAEVAKLTPIADIVKSMRNKAAKAAGVSSAPISVPKTREKEEDIRVEDIPF